MLSSKKGTSSLLFPLEHIDPIKCVKSNKIFSKYCWKWDAHKIPLKVVLFNPTFGLSKRKYNLKKLAWDHIIFNKNCQFIAPLCLVIDFICTYLFGFANRAFYAFLHFLPIRPFASSLAYHVYMYYTNLNL